MLRTPCPALAASWPTGGGGGGGMPRHGVPLSVMPKRGIAGSGTQWLFTQPPSVSHGAPTHLAPRYVPYITPNPRPLPPPVQCDLPPSPPGGPGDK